MFKTYHKIVKSLIVTTVHHKKRYIQFKLRLCKAYVVCVWQNTLNLIHISSILILFQLPQKGLAVVVVFVTNRVLECERVYHMFKNQD